MSFSSCNFSPFYCLLCCVSFLFSNMTHSTQDTCLQSRYGTHGGRRGYQRVNFRHECLLQMRPFNYKHRLINILSPKCTGSLKKQFFFLPRPLLQCYRDSPCPYLQCLLSTISMILNSNISQISTMSIFTMFIISTRPTMSKLTDVIELFEKKLNLLENLKSLLAY